MRRTFATAAILIVPAALLGVLPNGARSQNARAVHLLPPLGAPIAVGLDDQAQAPKRDVEVLPVPVPAPALGLRDLLQLSLEQHPALRQAGFAIDAAYGRAVQAGLYPNPTVTIGGEEVGKRGGIHALPLISQEIVTANKRALSRAVVLREVDQAQLGFVRQRYALITGVRQVYFEVLAIQRRIEVLGELVNLARQTYEKTEKQIKADPKVAKIDLFPLQIEQNRLKAEALAAQKEQEAARRRLASAVGVPQLPPRALRGSIEFPLPDYDFPQARAFVLQAHPEVQIAEVGVSRAELTVRREQAQAIPNITLAGGYQRNFNDREHQAVYQVGVPLPLFNRNQGNIRAAQADVSRAMHEVSRVQNDLAQRLATAFGQYEAARERAKIYSSSIIPDAQKAYELYLTGFQKGVFDVLRVIQAQRAVAEARLEYVRALSDAWRAASEISGLLLEEHWPRPAAEGNAKE